MDEINRDLHAALDGLDENRRDVLRRMILKSAFVTPIVASFAMAGLTVDAAAQCTTNTTCSGPIIKSDQSVKKDVVRIGTHRLGFGIYCFSFGARTSILGCWRKRSIKCALTRWLSTRMAF
jgi:hypothetical protein